MQIVVLAAGAGIRLGDHTREIPKSLLEIAPGRPYLAYQLEALARIPGLRGLLVGGFAIDRLRAFVAEHPAGASWPIIENTQFHKGNLYSLAAARHILRADEDFYIFNADHFYSDASYHLMLSTPTEHVTIYCDRDRTLVADDMKVLSQNGVLKKIAKDLSTYDAGYVGVTRVPASAAVRYWRAFDDTARALGDRAHVEAVLARLAGENETVKLTDISGSWWTEIDTEEDLQRARALIRARVTS